ncbi:YdbH domain-containing protein [Novosphingobium guangzhouense]|uniref:C4-dicarboxylate ABC transporter n=1 Tax=Novosphingobium guangzhouense TaxID=1850347 RepID=A0A2K2G0N5_9SPHN|nr:YdbH domain-containing protein [Novosphingobium guangzhouense]PNU04587.1 C4-dicarboxylate ABC transporter [Novosphingobium guangzhouense]
MSQEIDQTPDTEEAATGGLASRGRLLRGRAWGAPVLVVGGLLAAALGATWLSREEIAANLIERELDSLGLEARYDIVRIGPSEQVIRNLVIGDPARPDLTVKELRIATRLSWGLPGVGRITVVKPRLYGSWHDGKLSFGSLDKAMAGGGSAPFEMPDYDLAVEDGRALIDSDHGRIGVKLAGAGELRDGFSGELAALSPVLTGGGCTTGPATLYGKLTTSAGKPRFAGPVRLASLTCSAQDLRLGKTAVQLDLTLDKALDGASGKMELAVGAVRYGAQKLAGGSGSGRFTYRDNALSATYRIAGRRLDTPQARLAQVTLEGRARSTGGLARFDIDADLTGREMALGSTVDRALLSAQQTAAGTLGAPIAAQVRQNLAREMRGSTVNASLLVRNSGDGLNLVVTRGSLKGGSGTSVLSLSRVQALFRGKGRAPRVTGNFTTGGRGLPQAWGRMEMGEGGRIAMNASMADYRAGTAMVGVPRVAMEQAGDGALSFNGQVVLSGDVPGGNARNLLLPVDGNWGADGRLAVWRRCTDVSFDALSFSNLVIDKRKLTLCPARGGAIVEGRPDNLLLAAGATSLDLSGHLGETSVRIASGPIGFAMGGAKPGVIKASAIKVALGPADTASHFTVSQLDAQVGKEIAGTFDDADISLAAVPLDMRQAAGRWRYANGVASIEGAQFTLVDREPVARFQPMIARDATLRLADNRITAQALLREPASDRAVARADIVHDLSKADGHADLAVDSLVFDDKLQPDALSRTVLGIVSDLKGVVRGTGRIDWNARGVTSRGRFATDGVDFAAALGPVRQLSGNIVFTDLLGMVTAPNQSVHIASMNPGIEVTDGTISYELRPGYNLIVNGGKWPFMNGTLTLDPARMQIGAAETRYYTLRVAGLDAADFVQHLELTNINASGVFDGELPMIFDEHGGRIENGFLRSRDPGGNVSYVGALTYKDLSAMGNFAFDALKSVNYRKMEIGLGGSLSGDIVTRISFDGLSQGQGASKNFITKQVAKLPIRFIVNIKAPFFSLFGSMRSLYDPTYVTDPRVLGLLNSDGSRSNGRPDATINVAPPAQQPAPAQSGAIQPPVSEKKP